MGRVIKFRAWDGAGMGMMMMPLPNIFGLHRFFGFISEDNPLMQYTGRNDKNGVEIYSDDIAKAWTKDGATLIGKVVIESDETVIETTDHQWPVASFTVLDRLEVIGNSHENPELLSD